MGRLMLLTQASGSANDLERRRLALCRAPGRVLRLTRIRYDDENHPIAYEAVVLPVGRFPAPPDDSAPRRNILELARLHGLRLGRASEGVSIVRAEAGVASHLGVSTGTPVMKLNRVTETAEGLPIEWRIAFCRLTDPGLSLAIGGVGSTPAPV